MCQESYGQNMKRRRIFLFRKALFITKTRVKDNTDVYAIKDQMMVSAALMSCDISYVVHGCVILFQITCTHFTSL